MCGSVIAHYFNFYKSKPSITRAERRRLIKAGYFKIEQKRDAPKITQNHPLIEQKKLVNLVILLIEKKTLLEELNQKATENIIKLTNTKDKYDIQEQRERIKLLKLDNKERTENNKITDAPINIIDEWAGDVEGATDDL